MDLYCPVCGEPWDFDSLHDVEGMDYQHAAATFRIVGCEVFGSSHNQPSQQTDRTFGLTRQQAAQAAYDLLGDDMDGAASMLDDLGF